MGAQLLQISGRVAQLLRGERELAEGVVSRACRAAQAEFIARSVPLAIDGTAA